MRKIAFTAYIALGLLASCIEPKEVGQGEDLKKAYFDVQGLIGRQVQLLNEKSPKVQKTTLIGASREEVVPEQVLWKKEMKLFEQTDINKPVLLRSYSIDTLAEQGSKRLVYQALNEDLKVRKLEVRLGSNGQAQGLKALVKEENPIYVSERELEMSLEQGRIATYSLKGYQKVKTQDTTYYQMDASIMW